MLTKFEDWSRQAKLCYTHADTDGKRSIFFHLNFPYAQFPTAGTISCGSSFRMYRKRGTHGHTPRKGFQG